MNEVIKGRTYVQFKQEFDQSMEKTTRDMLSVAEDFVVIGYLLREAEDTEILRDSGYRSMGEFAQKCYGISKDLASRYIGINREYSVGGYSRELDPKYKNFGYTKLAEMLALPGYIRAEITPDMTRADIREIKNEVREEMKQSDLEVLMEDREEEIENLETSTRKALFEIGREHPHIFAKLWNAVNVAADPEEGLMMALAPSGIAIIAYRIPGEGRCILSLNEEEGDIRITNTRSGEKKILTKDDLLLEAKYLLETEAGDWRETFREMYHMDPPEEKAEVAPAQPKRVVKSVPKPEKSALTPASEQEEQIPGRKEIGDYPGVVPEKNVKEAENEQQKDELSAGAAGSDLEDEREERACEEKLEKTDEKTCTEGNESYEDLREAAEELADGVHEVFWGWREAAVIPKEELEAALKNAKKLIKKIEQLIERS